MSERRDRLADELARAGDGLRPPDGWERRVWERIDREAYAAPPRRTGWLAAVAGLSVACVALMILIVVQQRQQHDAAESHHRRAIEASKRRQAEAEARIGTLMAEIDEIQQEQDYLQVQIDNADSEAERERLQQEVAVNKRRLETLREQNKRERATRAREEAHRAKINVTCDPDDPLCGL